ncbi:MAG: hypothetical protein AB1299_02755 [Thermoproteota archaeon]|jgi:hypothetical protein|nr:hypothetical protein [Candidatus Nitrosotenuis sp.]
MIDHNPHKPVVAISVEIVLMRKGGPQYQLVLARLEKYYDCKIFDCFEHPDYLKYVLREVYGDEYEKIIEQIEWELGESVSDPDVKKFLDVLKQG